VDFGNERSGAHVVELGADLAPVQRGGMGRVQHLERFLQGPGRLRRQLPPPVVGFHRKIATPGIRIRILRYVWHPDLPLV
jgi:hypothetical protein